MPEFINDAHKLQYETLLSQVDQVRSYLSQLESSAESLAAATNLKECVEVNNAVLAFTDVASVKTSQASSILVDVFKQVPNIDSISQGKPEEFLKTILDTVEDIGGSHYNALSGFVTDLAKTTPGEAVRKLALKELTDSGWSLKMDLNSDGKSAQLIKGSEVVDFLTAGFNGDVVTGNEILLGVVTKFEKEIFGFSVIEVGKEVDKLAKVLANGNPVADLMSGNLLNTVDNVLGKIGGNNEYVKQIRGVIKMTNGLIGAWTKAKTEMNQALEVYNKQKEIMAAGTTWAIEDLEAVTPPDPAEAPETPTTTLPPPDPETPSHVDPPENKPPQYRDGEAVPEELTEDPFEESGTVYDEDF